MLFYGLSHQPWWEKVAGGSFSATAIEGFYTRSLGPTVRALTKPPAATGVTHRYFEDAGEAIGRLLAAA